MKYMRSVLLWTLFTTITLGETRDIPLILNFNDVFEELTTLPEVPLELLNDTENKKTVNSSLDVLKGIIKNTEYIRKLPHLTGISGDPNKLNVKEENSDKLHESLENQYKRVGKNVDSEFGYLRNINDDFLLLNAGDNSNKRERRNDMDKPSNPSSDSDDTSDKDEGENPKKRVRRRVMTRPLHDSYEYGTGDDYYAAIGDTNKDDEQDYDDPMSYETKETYEDIYEKRIKKTQSETKKPETKKMSTFKTDTKKKITKNSMLSTNKPLPKTKRSKKIKASTKKPHSRTKAIKATKKPRLQRNKSTEDEEPQQLQHIELQMSRKKTYPFPSNENKQLRDNNANDNIRVMGKQLLDVLMNFNKCECNDKNIANSLCCYLKPYQNRQVEKRIAKNKPKNLQKAISKLNKNDKYIKEHDENKHTVSLSRLGNEDRVDIDDNYSALSTQQVEEEDLSGIADHNSVGLEDVSKEVNDYFDKMEENDNSAPHIQEENIDTHNFKSLIDYILS